MKLAKTVSESAVKLHHFMMPEHANMLGDVHGGIIMKMVDEAGALCAIRHAQRPAVTVAIDSMTFRSPVKVGDVLTLTAHLNYVGTSSMEVEIHVVAENPLTGELTHTNSAFAVYVALADDEHPVGVPQLTLESAEEVARFEAAEHRQQQRRTRRAETPRKLG